MSERIMKVLANCEQGLQDSEKLRARTNIGAIGGVRVTDSSGTTDLVPDSQGRVTVDLTDLDDVYIFWDMAFNREEVRAAIDAHKVIMDWDRTSHEHRFFSKYEEKEIDGNLCEIYHFAHVETDYETPFATTWRLGDKAYIYDTVRQVQWAEHDTKLFDHEVPEPASGDVGKVLTAGYDAQDAKGTWSWQTKNTGTQVSTRTAPNYQDVNLASMSITNPGQNYGATVKDGSGNTIGFFMPLHSGSTDAGKVIKLQESSGSYYAVWGTETMGMADLKPLTLEDVTVSSSQYALMVEDGKAYRFTMSTSGSVGINTTSEETVHTVLSFRNDGTGCNSVNITWKDETLGQHDIQINLYGQPQGVEYMFDVYVRRVRISDVNYCIARVYDYPVAWRQGRQYGTDADANGLIGLYN